MPIVSMEGSSPTIENENVDTSLGFLPIDDIEIEMESNLIGNNCTQVEKKVVVTDIVPW